MSLDETHRNQLREWIHVDLPMQEEGSIELVARAWAVRGQSVG